MKLLIGSKNTSSWSLRVWIVMRAKGIPFEEVNVPMRSSASNAQQLRATLPAGKVPCLIDGDVTVWETLAILEYLAEKFPDKALWPADQRARSHARAVSNEMHAGFESLRQSCPMRATLRFAVRARSAEVGADIARITVLWNEARDRFADRTAGPFLYGAFSIADGMFAPVVLRFHSYSVDVDPVSRVYMDAVRATTGWRDWLTGAKTEPRQAWQAPPSETDIVIEDLRATT
jgi:glutathione S-transferase